MNRTAGSPCGVCVCRGVAVGRFNATAQCTISGADLRGGGGGVRTPPFLYEE